MNGNLVTDGTHLCPNRENISMSGGDLQLNGHEEVSEYQSLATSNILLSKNHQISNDRKKQI